MITKAIKVTNPHGLHLRVAGAIAKTVQNSSSDVRINCMDCTNHTADGLSVIQMLMLEAVKGRRLELVVDGVDEEAVLKNIEGVFYNGAGI